MRITIGLATCGISAGGLPVFDALKEAGLNPEKVGCIGMCYNEPIVTVIKENKKEVYGLVTKDNVDKLISCIKENKECKELLVANDLNDLDFYKKQHRLVMENCGLISPLNLEQYKERNGYQGLNNALKLSPEEVIKQIEISSGLLIFS